MQKDILDLSISNSVNKCEHETAKELIHDCLAFSEIELIDFDDMKEEDILELEYTVYDLIEDYLDYNILSISSPNFYVNVVDEIVTLLFIQWKDVDVCNETDLDDIYTYVQCFCDNFFELFEDLIPFRSNFLLDRKEDTADNIVHISSCCTNKAIYANKIDMLRNIPQPKQRTPEWYEFRHKLFTASNIWKIFGTESQYNSIIYEKCKPYQEKTMNSIFNTNPMNWGVIYEPVSIKIYEKMFHTEVADFGCIRHPQYHFLAASPDGINVKENSENYGKMIEVKNIVNRDITGIPKEEYWIQMQIQMETCDLDECDFIETRIKEFENEEQFHQEKENYEWFGVILCSLSKTVNKNIENEDNTRTYNEWCNEPKYDYLIIEKSNMENVNITEWVEAKRKENTDYVVYNTRFWYLDEFSCVLVKRNRWWFEAAIPLIEETWKIIEHERETGYAHRDTKKNIANNALQKNENSIPSSGTICLIKLDENGDPC